jgi:hypothetical protein
MAVPKDELSFNFGYNVRPQKSGGKKGGKKTGKRQQSAAAGLHDWHAQWIDEKVREHEVEQN